VKHPAVHNLPAQNPPVQQSVQNTPVQNPPVQSPSVQAPNPPVPQVTPAQDPARGRELGELREQYNLMAVRAGSVKTGMRSLQENIARSGQSMRGDMQTTASRLEYLMQEAMSSIRDGDAAAAHKSLDSAELALETLERWLNR
jgi:hypothetical protein